MADSRNVWGWTARTPRMTVHTDVARRWLLPAAVISGALIGLTLILLLSEPGAAGGPQPVTNAWSTAAGVSVRSSFLARCETHGTSTTTCVCMFDEVTGQAAYSTPSAFASLDLEGSAPAPAASRVLAGAAQACPSTPAGAPPPASSSAPPASSAPAPSGGSGGPSTGRPI